MKNTELQFIYKVSLTDYMPNIVPDNCTLVLVPNRSQLDRVFREQPHFVRAQVFTYFGFIQRELNRYWPLVEKNLPPGVLSMAPTFLTTDTIQYILVHLVKKHQQAGKFKGVVAASDRIAIQIADNLNKVAVASLDRRKIGDYLYAALPGLADSLAFCHVQDVADEFVNICLETRLLNYSLAVELYHDQLCKTPTYLSKLAAEVRRLVVIGLEETIPAAQDLVNLLLDHVDFACLIYNQDGGHSTFFGADPASARELAAKCQVIHLEDHDPCPKTTFRWSEGLSNAILEGVHVPLPCDILMEPIETELRTELIEAIGHKILSLLAQGTPARHISVIAPFVDRVLEFALAQVLEPKGIAVENTTRSSRLLDDPYALALVTLAELGHPHWNMDPGFGNILETINLVLELDPVRSGLIAEHAASSNPPGLTELPPLTRSRVGYAATEKYDRLARWLREYTPRPELPVDIFLQRVFGEILSPLQPGREEVASCSRIITSAVKFTAALSKLNRHFPNPAGKYFVNMIRSGTLAAEPLNRPEPDPNCVILSTPYAYLVNGFTSQYQIWLDAASETWFRSDARELSNPHILSRRWSPGKVWDDEVDQQFRRENAARTVRALARRCTRGLIPAASLYNSFGWDQHGPLGEIMERVSQK